MEWINSLFRYLGYLALSLGLGWFSNLSGDDNDFIAFFDVHVFFSL